MRKLMLFTIGFCIACALFAYFYVSWLWILGISALCLSGILRVASGSRVWVRAVAVVFLGCAIGCGWTQLLYNFYITPVSKLDSELQEIEITVLEHSYETDYGVASDGLVFLDGKPYCVKFYINDSTALMPGDAVSGTFRFRLTTGTGTEDATYHRGEGKILLLYGKGDVQIIHAEKTPWFCYPALWRETLLKNLEDLFPKDTLGFAQALLLGERNNLDYESQTALRVSGIQHIVAVSGLHISILFGLFELLTLRKRYLTLFVAAPALVLFAAIVGFTPSVTRACIMQILMILAQVVDKEYDPPTSLAFSVLVMLVVNPMTVISVSFQLSVGCVIGILLFYSKIKGWIQSRKWFGSAKGSGMIQRLKRWSCSSVSITLSATIITMPLVACYFGAVSLIGIVTNLLTLWCISFIFYGIVACSILAILGVGVSSLLAQLISWPIRFVLAIAKVCAKIPLAAVYTESVYIVIWLVFCYVLLLMYFLMKNKHPVVLASCCTGLLFLAVFASWLEPRLYNCHATFLDVGQGQCIILQSGARTFLVDCGGSSDTGSADIAAETLLSRGISRLDGLVLTHYDRDHAGGVPYLLSRIRVDNIYLPDISDTCGIGAALAEREGSCAVTVNKDMDILFGNGKMRIFGPAGYDLGNESCICVLFQTENCDILITGDRGELGEMLLLHQHTLPQLEVLVAGHHGSAGSTSQRLLEATNPETVVISLAENNAYGHPAQTLLDRLLAAGCAIYRTDQNGTVIYRR